MVASKDLIAVPLEVFHYAVEAAVGVHRQHLTAHVGGIQPVLVCVVDLQGYNNRLL